MPNPMRPAGQSHTFVNPETIIPVITKAAATGKVTFTSILSMPIFTDGIIAG